MKPTKQLLANQPRTTKWHLINFCKTITSPFSSKSKPMLIAEEQDQYGSIQILEVGDYRFLEFGNHVEQSCVFMPDPSWLEYDYTRAMLMGALAHPQATSALFLGLGAGTLSTACLKYLPIQEAKAIELRPAVVSLAKQYLSLPDDPKLTIQIGDALKLLEEESPKDLIFLDLYTDTGPSTGHSEWNFLGRCLEKLNPNGWLIINQWAQHDGSPKDESLLKVRFQRHYWQCLVNSGNIVLLIPQNKTQQLELATLEKATQHLEPQLGYSLQPILANLVASQ